MDNNRRLKLISGALELTKQEIASAVTAGGIETSNSRADSWLRSTGSQKNPTGNSQASAKQNRHREMSDAEFDAFCLGLKSVMTE